MERPALNAQLSADEFRHWYWLKEELVVFCRLQGLSTSGLKREIEGRVAACLAEGRVPSRPRGGEVVARRTGKMPERFSMHSVIGEGWRCGPALGKFLRSELGDGFRFNAEVREFIHHGVGRPLGEVAAVYRESAGRRRAIPEQLEYNRHFREYFHANPGATREAAIAAWWKKRGKRREV